MNRTGLNYILTLRKDDSITNLSPQIPVVDGIKAHDGHLSIMNSLGTPPLYVQRSGMAHVAVPCPQFQTFLPSKGITFRHLMSGVHKIIDFVNDIVNLRK